MENRDVFSEEDKLLFSKDEMDMVNRNSQILANAMINQINSKHKATAFEKKYAEKEMNRLKRKYDTNNK